METSNVVFSKWVKVKQKLKTTILAQQNYHGAIYFASFWTIILPLLLNRFLEILPFKNFIGLYEKLILINFFRCLTW